MADIKRILLVEDSKTMNFYNRFLLQKIIPEVEVLVALNGKEALEVLQREQTPFDVIMLDLNMPVMNGWEFLEEYTKLQDSFLATKTLVLILSSSIVAEDQQRVESISLVAKFLKKPLSPEKVDLIVSYFKEMVL